MRKIREILRLVLSCKLSYRQTARSCHVSRPVASEYVRRIREAGLNSWAEIEKLTENELELLLKMGGESTKIISTKQLPDYQKIQVELRNKHVTLMLLWTEYKEQYPDGYEYVQYCNLYRKWRGQQDYCMRQKHKAGEKIFVDYCDGLEIVNAVTGEIQKSQLFVMVWGASNYTFAEASMNQNLYSWTNSHVRAFEYFQCVSRIVVPDNLKSGVKSPCRYEPDVNPTYLSLAEHYQFAVIPARVRRPRDKAKVEAGVLIAQRWILAVLRHRRFGSLAELNHAIRELLEKLNDRQMRKLKKSRRQLFVEVDQPQSQSLPENRWEYCEWEKAKVNLDYHVEVESHYYSVPFQFNHAEVDVRKTARTIEILHHGQRIASHPRSDRKHQHTTVTEHMPIPHQHYAQWTPTRIINWAAKTGPWTSQLVTTMLASRQHPEQAYRSALGIFRLGARAEVGAQRLENACRRAVEHKSCFYKSVRSILEKGLDRYEPSAQTELALPPIHDNIRGSEYYR